jgi:hypothetical protein
MKTALPWMLLLLASCSTTSTTENSDSTAITEDTVVLEADHSDAEAEEYAEEEEYGESSAPLDTTITETLDLQSNFKAAQIKPTIAYVYYEEGANVIEKNMHPFAADALVIGEVEYRSPVTLVEPLVNNLPADTMTISGLKGRMIPAIYKGQGGYIFSGFLLNLPVPEEGLSPVDYFTQTLHMVKPAVNVRHECGDCNESSNKTTYYYEQEITVADNSYYETYDRSVYFGRNFTLQEAFLFARHFYGFLKHDFIEFPTAPMEREQEEGAAKEVAFENGRMVRIISVTGEGCYEEEGVHIEDGRVKISANGGC